MSTSSAPDSNAMVRTQVYLTEQEHQALQAIARQTRKSQSELIREAVDTLVRQFDVRIRLEKIRAARGIWRDRTDLPDFKALRGEWDRLLKEEG
jgi:Arc/MetJ-type ribon-helix-helix transcriptional regulator